MTPPMDRQLAVVATLLLAGCSTGDLPGSNRLAIGGGDIAMPVRDTLSRRYLTVVRQQYDFSCGSAALATLLRYHYGDAATERTTFLGMWRDGDRAQIRRLGFSLLDMKRYLAGRGIAADGYRVTVEQVAAARTPGIVLVNAGGYRHFVVVKGIDGNALLIGDPSLGLRRLPVRDFAPIWNGIYFALGGMAPTARASFGRADEWALLPRGPAHLVAEPVSQQALALTRPLPGEL